MKAIEKLIAGEYKAALKLAKQIPLKQIYRAALNEHGMCQHKANVTANFLKGKINQDNYLDGIK